MGRISGIFGVTISFLPTILLVISSFFTWLIDLLNFTVLVQEVTALSKVGKVVDIWHAGKMFYTLSTWGLAFGGYV